MKKLFTTFVLALLALNFAFAGSNEVSLKTGLSAHDHPLDNGFILRAGIGLPSKKYDLSQEQANVDGNSDYVPKTSFGIEIGSQWYVWRSGEEKMGLAVNVNWLDLQAGIASTEDFTNSVIMLNLLEFGPMYTYAFNDDIGVDAFFNFRPTVMSTIASDKINTENNSVIDLGAGMTYAAGASFRWRALLVGIEYGFGKVKLKNTDSNNDYNYKAFTNMFKINLGVKL